MCDSGDVCLGGWHRRYGRVAPEIRRAAMAAADGGGAYGGKRLQVIGVCWEGRGVGRMK